MLGDRLDPDDRGVRQPRPVPGPGELLRCLGYRLGPAAGLHDQRDAVTLRPDAGGDPVASRDRVGKLDHLLAGQHPVSLRLDPHAPSHPKYHPSYRLGSSAANSSRLRRSCPDSIKSTCGATTTIPSVLGRKPASSPLCAFIQTSRWHSRDSRSAAMASTSGSPRSSPSEQTTTTPPRARPRWP